MAFIIGSILILIGDGFAIYTLAKDNYIGSCVFISFTAGMLFFAMIMRIVDFIRNR